MPVAAAPALLAALVAHLREGVPSCPRWYGEGAVPKGAPLPYGTIGGHEEARASFFAHHGGTLALRLKWYSEYVGDRELLLIWSDVYAALERVRLPIEGHAHLLGGVELQATYIDPHGYRNAVARYTARTLEAPA